MNEPDFMTPIPQPPHDPTFWLLNGRVGWKALDLEEGLEVEVESGALVLAPRADPTLSLTEPSGSLAGLTLPANVAWAPEGVVLLLVGATGGLKWFDPCDCAFKPVPCFGGLGEGPGQFRDPQGIGIACGNLFVCDAGNHRLSVFALRGLALRGHWSPPPSTELAVPWEPFDVEFDSHGRVFVGDPANGLIHRFDSHGRWEKSLSGFAGVSWIHTDCENTLYVATTGIEGSVQRVDTDGNDLGSAERADAIRRRFSPLPFTVDELGNLDLRAICAPDRENESSGLFDRNGEPIKELPAPHSLQYEGKGTYDSEALDSRIYRCQWHRVVLHGAIPPGTRIHVRTFTAEALLTRGQITSLPPERWETKQTAHVLHKGEWDCLIRSEQGRYLWLRLILEGNGKATPTLESVRVEFPRVSLRRYLPAVFGANPSAADFTDRFLGLFDTTLRSIEEKIDKQARLFDPLSTPAERDPKTGVDFLSWLASWIGVTLDRQWPEAKRRRFLKQAGRLFDLRGTREGLWRQLILLLEMDTAADACTSKPPKKACLPPADPCRRAAAAPRSWRPPPLILEHFQLRRWLHVGTGRLGEEAVLWGRRIVNRSQLDRTAQSERTQLVMTQDPQRDPFHVYAHKFTVFVPACFGLSEGRRKALGNLLEAESPAHAQYDVRYVEPRFRIGVQSMIGFDSAIARLPWGVTLDATPLGPASVLGEPSPLARRPSMTVGREDRIGTTTKLN